jgi:hypothetical protein
MHYRGNPICAFPGNRGLGKEILFGKTLVRLPESRMSRPPLIQSLGVAGSADDLSVKISVQHIISSFQLIDGLFVLQTSLDLIARSKPWAVTEVSSISCKSSKGKSNKCILNDLDRTSNKLVVEMVCKSLKWNVHCLKMKSEHNELIVEGVMLADNEADF